ncbi:MAG: transglycosylase SLT domain-containing protein [Bdellovibrionales bacterium]|nr:lytic transglycosylase domain-containing protein [Bdellovibrionales bacterium]NQZ19374.1 transglycosylase SLT domain-containing protein [Bdellovibrionales bacterium]
MTRPLIKISILFFMSLVMSWPSFANTVTEEASRSFIGLRNLNMNFRSVRDPNNVLGTVGRNTIIQIPDNFGEYDSRGNLDLGRTLAEWENKTRDGRYAALAPRACANSRCVPVRLHDSSNPSIADGTIGYISLDYINENVDSSRYVTQRTLLETRTQLGSSGDNGGTVTGGSETTSPGAGTSGSHVSTDADNCLGHDWRTRGHETNNCLHSRYGDNPVEKASVVMRDVIEINSRRSGLQLDPRLSVCMAYRESGFSPNAQGGTPDWGMYQVIDDTGARTIRRHPPVTEGFQGFSWTNFRNRMLRNTLAQADLHHAAVLNMANWSGCRAPTANLNSAMANGTRISQDTVQRLASCYNTGNGRSVNTYGRKIESCYSCMTGISTADGRFTNPSGLQGCLDRAK